MVLGLNDLCFGIYCQDVGPGVGELGIFWVPGIALQQEVWTFCQESELSYWV